MAYLITAADVTAETVADLNVSYHKLRVAIRRTQPKYLRPVLGEPLYEALLALVATAPEAPAPPPTGAPTPAKETYATALAAHTTALAAWKVTNVGPLLTLWDKCKPMLCAWALIKAWPSLLGHITEAGFVKKVGEKSTGTTSADIVLTDRTYGSLVEDAEFEAAEFAAWLAKNAGAYTAYRPLTPTPPTGSGLLGGIYLG